MVLALVVVPAVAYVKSGGVAGIQAGMVVGTVVLVVWKEAGLDASLYEIVPGFAANAFTLLVMNRFVAQTEPGVLRQFDEVVEEMRTRRL